MLGDNFKNRIADELHGVFDNIKPKVSKGGSFPFLHSLYDGIYTGLFQPGSVTNGRVHIKDGIDSKRTMVINIRKFFEISFRVMGISPPNIKLYMVTILILTHFTNEFNTLLFNKSSEVP